ncbi:hypothetical protein [Afifella aestuarii]|uniref:hypothetical protein n=1 Tax=Afifella aestuarii TaxID=1909496 RepID=UPI000FE3A4A8|nr:hypothetical protein [Afifella aestuarii]
MEQASLDRMIVESLGDVDAAAKRLQEIEKRVSDAIEDVCAQWADHNNWLYKNNWLENDDCFVMPKDWRTESTEWPAWFELWYGAGDNGDQGGAHDFFWLTRFCREGSGQIGFRFQQDVLGKTPWKKLVRENARCVEHTSFIVDDEPSFFLPFRIDKTELAKAIEDGREEAFSEALRPMTEALDHIKASVDVFDTLLNEMRSREGA